MTLKVIVKELKYTTSLIMGNIPTTGHQKHPNPYEIRFIINHVSKLITFTALKPFTHLTTLVLYIIVKSKKSTEKIIHANDWYFYHETLLLMTESILIDEFSIKERWRMPQNGLNDGTRSKGRPVGNSPDFIP